MTSTDNLSDDQTRSETRVGEDGPFVEALFRPETVPSSIFRRVSSENRPGSGKATNTRASAKVGKADEGSNSQAKNVRFILLQIGGGEG